MSVLESSSLFARVARAIFLVLLRLAVWSGVVVAIWWSAGAILQWPAAVPERADAVVVLGGGTDIRFKKARQLVEAGYTDRLLLINPTLTPLREIAQGVRNLHEVHAEAVSRSTWDEAVNTRAWMEAHDVQHVLIVSDPPHLLRVSYAFGSVLRGTGRSFTLIAADAPWWSAWRWWDNEQAAINAGIEVLKLGYYVVRYRFGFGEGG